MKKPVQFILLAATLLFAPRHLTAQDAPAQTLRVFIDCMFCDLDYLRTELGWVDYMRDRADAQVHVLVSSQGTGGGGQRYSLEFIGLRDFEGRTDTLTYTSSSNDTEDLRRQGLTRTIAAGLLRYVVATPVFNRMSITVAQAPSEPGATPAANAPQNDPWNFWTFRISLSGNTSGESLSESFFGSTGFSANRTTEAWKFSSGINMNYNEQSFTFDAGTGDTTITSVSRRYNWNGLLVKSITDHISAGVRADIGTSTFGNTSLNVNVSPAIEYNIFPYSESTRRQFMFQYSAGMRMFEYRDTTIYFETEETRPFHSLNAVYYVQQPWGSVNVGFNTSQYLHDTSKYNAGIGGGLSDIRLFKGFSFSVFGDYSVVRDQLNLLKENLTQAEILLRQREVATDYRYSVHMGISYRFGSIFNNVVNPRFGGGGGMMIMF